MADDEQFSLCWNNFNSNLSAGFHESLCRGDLVDVTLTAEGQFVKAHRLVLSVCSPYFRKMFTQMPPNQHAFVFLKDVSHSALKDLIQFMYCGEVNVKQEALPAFISTAEALQIKGLTDSDPPASQSPAEPSTPTPQIQTINTSPRVRQRTTTRTYKLETVVDDGVDEHHQQQQQQQQQQQNQTKVPQATQIVIQTTAPTATIGTQQQHLQQVVQQAGTVHQIANVAASAASTSTTGTTVSNSTHKRTIRNLNSSGGPQLKRTKNSSTTTATLVDPLDTANEVVTSQPQTITVQTSLVTSGAAGTVKTQPGGTDTTTEYIDLPMDLPTKSEPDYAEEGADVEGGEHDGAYVEDDTYGDMRYDESYFTENEDGGNVATASTNATSANASNTATTSKAIIKQQQQSSYSDSFTTGETGDQTNNDAQDLVFIESPWATPCLVLHNFMYNCHSKKNNKEYWRCHNYSKKDHSQRCRSRCVLENGKLKMITGGPHNHSPHTEKIERIKQRNRFVQHGASLNVACGIATGFARIKYPRRVEAPSNLELPAEITSNSKNPTLPKMVPNEIQIRPSTENINECESDEQDIKRDTYYIMNY